MHLLEVVAYCQACLRKKLQSTSTFGSQPCDVVLWLASHIDQVPKVLFESQPLRRKGLMQTAGRISHVRYISTVANSTITMVATIPCRSAAVVQLHCMDVYNSTV